MGEGEDGVRVLVEAFHPPPQPSPIKREGVVSPLAKEYPRTSMRGGSALDAGIAHCDAAFQPREPRQQPLAHLAPNLLAAGILAEIVELLRIGGEVEELRTEVLPLH